ncbi:hypothetical protein HDU77_000752, partial [Chytriomyces hyalinus]
LKNSRAAVLATIEELQQCNFERSDAIWAMYTSSTPVIPAKTIADQVALHAEVNATWTGQDEHHQLNWKQAQNPGTLFVPHPHLWTLNEMSNYFIHKLGGVCPTTGLDLDPSNLACN